MWIDKQVSLYTSHRDNTGRPATYRQILLSEFGKDFPMIYKLRELEKLHDNQQVNDVDYKIKKAELKSKLQCFAPSALLRSRAKDNIIEINRTGIMQLDFDYADIQGYDIEELKHCVFNLTFICFCGLSCSSNGFYAFQVFGMNPDTSNGRNVNDLRYLSYDANMLIREQPQILRVKHLKGQETLKQFYTTNYTKKSFAANSALINKELKSLQVVNVGNRWQTVQKVSYTLGGLNNSSILNSIKKAIESNGSFAGEENKYLQCAEICFNAGTQNLLK